MADCWKCGKPCLPGRRQHVECPKPDAKPLSREDHDEIISEQEILAATCNRLLVDKIPGDVFAEAWNAVLAGKLSREDLQAWLYGIGKETGHGSISGVEYKQYRNQIEETMRKTDIKLRMTAVRMGDKSANPKNLSLAQLKAKEAKR